MLKNIEKLFLILLLIHVSLFAEVDLQKGMYDAAEEMMRFDEKMNKLIAEHNEISFDEDKEMRLNDNQIEDFEETKNGYVLEKYIEDNNNTQIEISVKERMLTITVTIREKEEIKYNHKISYETTMSKSSQSLFVPNDADINTIEESYLKGILKIKFLKKIEELNN